MNKRQLTEGKAAIEEHALNMSKNCAEQSMARIVAFLKPESWGVVDTTGGSGRSVDGRFSGPEEGRVQVEDFIDIFFGRIGWRIRKVGLGRRKEGWWTANFEKSSSAFYTIFQCTCASTSIAPPELRRLECLRQRLWVRRMHD